MNPMHDNVRCATVVSQFGAATVELLPPGEWGCQTANIGVVQPGGNRIFGAAPLRAWRTPTVLLNGGKATDLGILLIRGSLLLCAPTVINVSRKGKMTNNLRHREYVFKVAIVFVVY